MQAALLSAQHSLVALLGVALLLEVAVGEAVDTGDLDPVTGERLGALVKALVLDGPDGTELDLLRHIPGRVGIGDVLANRVHPDLLGFQPGETYGKVGEVAHWWLTSNCLVDEKVAGGGLGRAT